MRPMRKLKAEDVSPERERSVEVRNRNAGVICGNNAKGFTRAHARVRQKTYNAQRTTPNVQRSIQAPVSPRVAVEDVGSHNRAVGHTV